MATNKKATKRKKPSSRPDAPKKPKTSKKKVPTKAAKKMSAPKKPKTAAKKRAAPRKKTAKSQAAVPSPKTFAEKIRDRAPATEVWYRVGDVLSHGVILGPGAAGNVMVVSNGVVSGVPAEDLFETQAAVAAR